MHDVDGRNANAPAHDDPGGERVLDVLWVVAACVACAVGCLAALITLQVDTGAGWLAVGGLTTSAVLVGMQGVAPFDLPAVLRILRTSVVGAVGLLSLVALLRLTPGIALAVAGYLVLLSPYVRRAVSRRLAGAPARGPDAPPDAAAIPRQSSRLSRPVPRSEAEPVNQLGELSDADLCRAWRASYLRLRRAGRPSDVAAVAALRGRLLDELHRRNATAYEAWISSGARAASDPARYFCRKRS